ncbi:hypothetical protein RclHR1_10870005 [Rhizophagus clarus]|uniref:Uncharacterized protein n=1 Tax=Rhizophagus clarus TaxID=94130 RepID=A0A2Z6QHH6_9GLOM|nr:hypothetical protein RclHR1_10870005 [Rhizophagus clarus]GES86109.1 hypothetical protein RCL_jg18252.t1 [Rhizophagus clarus]
MYVPVGAINNSRFNDDDDDDYIITISDDEIDIHSWKKNLPILRSYKYDEIPDIDLRINLLVLNCLYYLYYDELRIAKVYYYCWKVSKIIY